MAAILDAAGVDRAVIGGHSLGGYLSLAFHVAHPERVAALVLIDTGPGYRSDDGRQKWNRMAEGYAADLEQKGLAALGRQRRAVGVGPPRRHRAGPRRSPGADAVATPRSSTRCRRSRSPCS